MPHRVSDASLISFHAKYLHYKCCNFARVHQTLRVTPAMEAGVTDHGWSLDEISDLLDDK